MSGQGREPGRDAPPKVAGTGSPGGRDALPRVAVSGSPRERGRQYGSAASSAVDASLAAYERLFAHYSGIDWVAARRRAQTFVAAITAYGERYLEEMDGIAEGAGCDFEDILALNVRSELRYAGPVAQLTAASTSQPTAGTAAGPKAPDARSVTGRDGSASGAAWPMEGECTAAVALPRHTADGHTLLAQNWDWKTHTRTTNLLLEVQRDDGPDFVTMVEAGLLAKAGMNERGLGLVTNTLVSSFDRGEPGVPYHVVLRSILESASISEALGRVLSAERSSSANYLLACGDGLAVDLECRQGDAGGVRLEAPGDRVFAHANHFGRAPAPASDLGIVMIPDSFFRRERLDELVNRGPVTVESLQAAFGDHANHPDGVCSHEHEDEEEFLRSATIASLVMDLSERRIWICDGNPCETPYRELDCFVEVGP